MGLGAGENTLTLQVYLARTVIFLKNHYQWLESDLQTLIPGWQTALPTPLGHTSHPVIVTLDHGEGLPNTSTQSMKNRCSGHAKQQVQWSPLSPPGLLKNPREGAPEGNPPQESILLDSGQTVPQTQEKTWVLAPDTPYVKGSVVEVLGQDLKGKFHSLSLQSCQ